MKELFDYIFSMVTGDLLVTASSVVLSLALVTCVIVLYFEIKDELNRS